MCQLSFQASVLCRSTPITQGYIFNLHTVAKQRLSYFPLCLYVHTFGLLQELEWKRERTENDLSSHVSRRATSSHHASSRFGFSHCVQCHSQGRQRTTAEQMRNVMKVKAPSSRLLLQEFIALEAIPSNTLKGLSSYAYLLKSLKSTLRRKIRQLKIHKHNRLKVNLL